MRRSLVVSLALLAIVRSPAVAQTCMGMASYSSGPVQVAGHGSFTNGVNSFGGSMGYGLPSSVFGDVGVSMVSADGFDSSVDLGADLGYQIPVGKAQVCPVASLAYGTGPDADASSINSSTRSGTFGFAIGAPIGTNPRMQIVPAAGLGLAYSKLKTETAIGSAEGSDTYGVAQLGVGLVFNQNIAIRPSVAIPLGSDLTNDATFGVTVGFNFGPKH